MNEEKNRLTERLAFSSQDTEKIYQLLSQIDAVKLGWDFTKKVSPQIISRLTRSVIITSTGSSNRIEGNKLTDEQVEELYKNLRIKKFRTRDQQEIAGYLEMIKFIFSHYKEIPLTENIILQLHTDMLSHSDKDERHRGKYKVGSNKVEAKDQSGKIVGVIFDPTPPYLVKKEMQELIDWYTWAVENKVKHPIILIANFIFEFLAIHPFQDGNGRMSRLLTNLLLLQAGYLFASIASHEKLVEENKTDYYLALNKTQKSWKTETETLTPWVLFFAQATQKQADFALKLLQSDLSMEFVLSEKQLKVWNWIQERTDKTFAKRDIIAALDLPERTVESILKKLIDLKKIERLGEGKGIHYRMSN